MYYLHMGYHTKGIYTYSQKVFMKNNSLDIRHRDIMIFLLFALNCFQLFLHFGMQGYFGASLGQVQVLNEIYTNDVIMT